MLAPSKKPSQVRQSLAGAGSGTTSRQRPQPKGPSLSETFSYLLVPLDLLNRLMSTLLSPILAHVVNSVILLGLGFLALYFLLPFLLSRVKWGFLGSLRVLWNVLRGKGTGLSLPGIPDFKNISPRAIYGAVRGTGGLCSSIYLPLLCSRKTKNETYDVGRVARALHKEGRLDRPILIDRSDADQKRPFQRKMLKISSSRSSALGRVEWKTVYIIPSQFLKSTRPRSSTDRPFAGCGNLLQQSKLDHIYLTRTSWGRN